MRRPPMSLAAATIAIGALAAGVVTVAAARRAPRHVPDNEGLRATLQLADGTEIGGVQFVEDGEVTVVGVTLDVPEGVTAVGAFHGFHIHANDDPSNGEGCRAEPTGAPSTWFASADAHLRSDDQVHGDHDGDLPPLLLDADGQAHAEFATDRFTLDDVAGRAVILHAGPDNLGNVPTGSTDDRYTANSPTAADKTGGTGNAGDRVACGVVPAPD